MKIWQQDWISKWAIYSPDKIALKEHESSTCLTYDELNKLGNRVAHYFSDELGLKKGDRIAIIAENSIEHFILFVTAQKTGLILVPMNHRLTASELDYLLSKTAPKLVLYDNEHKKQVLETPFVKSNEPILSSLDKLEMYFDKKYIESKDNEFSVCKVLEDDPIFILFTSGTTGFPKGALYTHKMLFWNSINTAMSLIINSETRTLNCMPLFHTGGWNVMATPVFHHGGYLVVTKNFEPKKILNIIDRERLTIFMGVPTMLKMMADEEEFEKTDYSSLHYFIVGGEAMPIPLIEKWSDKRVAIRQGYGLTEVGPNLTSLHQKDAIRKKGSIGRPNFYVEIKIKDKHDNANNNRGELLLKGPMVTPGYWRDKNATDNSIVDGWFHTGDIVQRDEEGYLYVVDRYKNMYISGGENVYPAEIERILCQHPGIVEAAVIGVKDQKWGEVGMAFIVRTNKDVIQEEDVINYCKTRLAKFKIPKKLEFIDALPKNDTGKIDRNSLKE